jgi:GNAT superfamily N-acetyltransferase
MIANADAPAAVLELRAARSDEAPQVLALIRELAEYERLLHDVVATEDDIRSLLFGDAPRAFCEIAEWNGEVAGFALWFYNASTFRGRHGIYLEDLYVRPAFRSHGIGKALIGRLAQRCVDEGLPRLQWQVLDWNTSAIDFYESLGARLTPEWIGCHVEPEVVASLAAKSHGTAP